ncbi:hypothetical protein SMC26_05125 [Actinomadura fulvescens]|uniref:Uncharacterized protein n=1 Tax=Actinomadura fulvescens TaxID=46160 RepID=A0ABN3Q6R9_9ACTN
MNRPETHDRAGVKSAVMVLPGGTTWRTIDPAVADAPHLLAAVAAASPTEIWVAGHAGQRPLLARWDGSSWIVPPGPEPEAALVGAGIQGIALTSGPVQAIAVGGGYDRLAGAEVPLIRHWNGSSWSAAASPEPADYVLTDVTAAGAEAWAVGHGFPWGAAGPVALHWSGTDWEAATMPRIAKGKLLAVSATAADDVWAVGADDRAGLIMRYDGRAWTRVPCPATRFPLTGVVAIAPDEAWAVGRDRVLHWNGRKWKRVKAPITAANTITATASDDIWVAGGHGELAHHDGHRWTLTTPPQPVGDNAVWLASTSLPDGVCVVGSHQVVRTDAMDAEPRIRAQSGDN